MYKPLLILVMMAQSLASLAQSESGLLLEAEAEKKLSKKFSVALDADMRTRNDFKTMDRWSIGIGGEYKPIKNLKLGAGYTLLNTNFREDVSFQTSGIPKKWRPSYWGVRHRFSLSATGSYKFSNNIRICADCMVGAGAVVIRDISEAGTYIGVPAQKLCCVGE